MSFGWPNARRLRFDPPQPLTTDGPDFALGDVLQATGSVDPPLQAAIDRTRWFLLDRQHDDGYWVGELEGDTILESEYVLLLTYLSQENTETVRLAANAIRNRQLPEGGWAIYPGGPVEISASVKAYFALKIAGDSADAEHMQQARRAVLAAGGIEGVNSFTRFYLALLGVIGYAKCPAIPPELILIPRWMPFNIYEMSAWSRTILIPLSIISAHRPRRELPAEMGIRELFVGDPAALPVCMPPSQSLDAMTKKTWVNWHKVFLLLDRGYKLFDRLRIRPFRKRALRKMQRWMLARFENSDGLGGIFPPIVWSVIALKCLGYGEDSAEVQSALKELEKLWIREEDALRLQPCQSPVWDTALASLALREAGVPATDPALRKSVRWLLSKEVRTKGDWAVRNVGHDAGGWFFEFNNEFYPDTDDTCMVVMALCRCLPLQEDENWKIDFLTGDWSPHEADKDAVAVLAGRTKSPQEVHRDLESIRPQLSAIWRGTRWILAMQNRDGGWGAFDVGNTRELFTRVPFADHNAMIDPSSADLAGRMLEMFADVNVSAEHPQVQKTLAYVWSEQEKEHCWYGRWGVNYIYGTWQTLVGLTAIGVSPLDERIRNAAGWLKSVQQENGGWGETPRSYDEPQLKGSGPVTPSQTAWAVLGLLAAGEVRSESVTRGIRFLIETQNADGGWDEKTFTGTGFPRVFYLRYHLYR
ncbi:MAG: terpene cyclase/mutase family protein, partial [Planctomycetes bacterium]|nr:terpene cyclase/mutase family protein [Planctomycetota bacterium]